MHWMFLFEDFHAIFPGSFIPTKCAFSLHIEHEQCLNEHDWIQNELENTIFEE